MFEELFSLVRTVFVLMIVAFVICFVIAMVKGVANEIEEGKKEQERRKKEQYEKYVKQQRLRADIDRIKVASRQWNREYKIWFMQYLAERHSSAVALDKEICANAGVEFDIWDVGCVAFEVNIDGTVEMILLDAEAVSELRSYFRRSLTDYWRKGNDLMTISEEIINMLDCSIPDAPPEAGGILGSRNGEEIDSVVFDIPDCKVPMGCVYSPNVDLLNDRMSDLLRKKNNV